MAELESLLYKLFSEYSMQGAKFNQSYIRLSGFTELCRSAGLFTEKFSPTNLELVFHAMNNRNPNVSFATFCEMIPKILESWCPAAYAADPSAAFDTLVNEHLVPLSRSISQKLTIVLAEDLNISTNMMSLCQSLYKSFKEIYMKTFPWELNPSGSVEILFDKSLKGLEKLLKEFDVYPTIITKSRVHAIWRDVVIMQEAEFQDTLSAALLPKKFSDFGVVLTMSKFILVFFFCSLYGSQENLVNPDSKTEKFLVLLERVQLSLSKSWKNLNLVPAPDVLAHIMQQEGGMDLAAMDEQSLDESILTEISLDHEGIGAIDSHYGALQKLFNDYCALGDGGNTKFLRSPNYHRLLKDSGLLSEEKFNASLSQSPGDGTRLFSVDVDLIYTKLTASKRRTERQGQMDFLQFLKAVEIMAKKIHPGMPYGEAIQEVLDKHFLQLTGEAHESSTQGHDIKQIINGLKEESVIEVLGLVHRSVLYFYKFYAEKSGKMPFEKFLKFCKDFEIFPEILSRNRLSQIFLTLSALSEENDLEKHSVSSISSMYENTEARGNVIDQHLFVEALAIIACEVTYEVATTSVERICFLIERMSQSDGPSVVYKAQGHTRSSTAGEIHDMLLLLKNRYPETMDHAPTVKPTFFDLASRFKLASSE